MRAVDLFVPPFVVVQKNRFGLFSLFFPRTDLACVCCSPPFSSSSSVCHSLLVNGLMNFPPLVDSANARGAFTRKVWGGGIQTHRQTDRQDTQADKQADRQTKTHAHTQTHTHTHTHRQTDTDTHKDTHKDTHIHTHTLTHTKTCTAQCLYSKSELRDTKDRQGSKRNVVKKAQRKRNNQAFSPSSPLHTFQRQFRHALRCWKEASTTPIPSIKSRQNNQTKPKPNITNQPQQPQQPQIKSPQYQQ